MDYVEIAIGKQILQHCMPDVLFIRQKVTSEYYREIVSYIN